MHDIGTFVDDALAFSKLGDAEHLRGIARYAFKHGKLIDAVTDGMNILVHDVATGRWLSHPVDMGDDEDLESLIDGFDAIYDQLEPVDDPQEDFPESLPVRIVDILLEGDLDDFMSGFSRDQEREGGRPLDPAPTGQKVLRAVQFDTGHKLYIWRTDRQREHYGHGQPHSYYLGYRFVSPTGLIIYEDVGFHPGEGWNGEITDDVVLMLIQGLVLGNQDIDDEDLAAMTPEQRAWLEDEDRERIEMDVGGIDSLQGGPPPWRELKVRGRRQRS